jgi:Tfp pilus assembly protein PilP
MKMFFLLILSWSMLAAAAPPQNAPLQAVPIQSVVGGAVPPTSAMESIFTEDTIKSLRDPFMVPQMLQAKKELPKSDLEIFALKEFHLNGVITGPNKLRAIVSAPNGKTYFVAVGDRIGLREGRITAIQPDLIKVVEYEVDDRGKKIPDIFEIQLNGEMISLSQKEQ